MIPKSLRVEIKTKAGPKDLIESGAYGRVLLCDEPEFIEKDSNVVLRFRRLVSPLIDELKPKGTSVELEASALMSNILTDFALFIQTYLIHEVRDLENKNV
jgi:hypothetical protein